MKDPKPTTQFQQAVEDQRNKDENKKLLEHLAALRDAVHELQAEGVTLSVAVRPGAYKCPIEFDTRARVVANGTIHIGTVDLDFVFLGSGGGGSMRFAAHLGNAQVAQEYLSAGYNLKKTVSETILKVGASVALLDEFNIDEGGRPGIATGKALAVSPLLKLKSNPKP